MPDVKLLQQFLRTSCNAGGKPAQICCRLECENLIASRMLPLHQRKASTSSSLLTRNQMLNSRTVDNYTCMFVKVTLKNELRSFLCGTLPFCCLS